MSAESPNPILKLLFLALRVVMTFGSNTIDFVMSQMKSFVQNYNEKRSNGEETTSQIIPLIDEYLSVSLQFKNLWMADIKYWAPNRYVDMIGADIHDGKVAVVTGADRDVGQCTALLLARHGCKVIMGVKDVSKANALISRWTETNPEFQMIAFQLKTISLKSVREFANKVCESEPKVDILVNSAERLFSKRLITREGFERHFVENYLGHFLLTNLLLDKLKMSVNGRVINVSDPVFHIGSLDFSELTMKKCTDYWQAFAASKLCQVLFNRELAQRLRDTNVTTYAMSPNCLRNWKPLPESDGRYIFNDWFRRMSNPMNGAQTVMYLALREDANKESGLFYNNCQRIDYVSNRTDAESKRLWEVSEEMVKNVLQSDVSSDQ